MLASVRPRQPIDVDLPDAKHRFHGLNVNIGPPLSAVNASWTDEMAARREAGNRERRYLGFLLEM
jgi:hypothetical protein